MLLIPEEQTGEAMFLKKKSRGPQHRKVQSRSFQRPCHCRGD